MCTAITYQTKDFYFGRTLDYDVSYSEEVTVTPRNFPLPFRNKGTLAHHYAMIGMAHVLDDYPLYFDAMNEKGLAMAGAPHGVRALCVTPGPVLTRKAMNNMPTLFGRAAEVDELVDVILFMCSDNASFITGTNHVVDGGRLCMYQKTY